MGADQTENRGKLDGFLVVAAERGDAAAVVAAAAIVVAGIVMGGVSATGALAPSAEPVGISPRRLTPSAIAPTRRPRYGHRTFARSSEELIHALSIG